MNHELQARRWASFGDLSFVPAGLTRIPLEERAEACTTRTVLGSRHAQRPLVLGLPILVSSQDARSREAKVALARGAARAGAASLTGAGAALEAEREAAQYLAHEISPSRCGISVHDLRRADAIVLAIGSGAAPAPGAPSPARHPDMLGPDDMIIKIEELREATGWQLPIFVRLSASRVFDDVRLAAKAGADAVIVDGMEGGSSGIPALAAVCEARAALEASGLFGTVQLVLSGDIHGGADAAKALALGADAVCLGASAISALSGEPKYLQGDTEATSDDASEPITRWLCGVASEIQSLARACGKSNVHHLEPEDLRALSLESSFITGLPLAGTNRVAVGGPGWHV